MDQGLSLLPLRRSICLHSIDRFTSATAPLHGSVEMSYSIDSTAGLFPFSSGTGEGGWLEILLVLDPTADPLGAATSRAPT
jgi:hypothetical protein